MSKKVLIIAILISISLINMTGCSRSPGNENRPSTPAASSSTGQPKQEQQIQEPVKFDENTKTGQALVNLAVKEQETLSGLDNLVRQVDDVYGAWQRGRMSRQELSEKCMELLPQANKLNNDLKKYLTNNPLSEEDKKNPLYDDGLKYGKDMTLYVCGFISECLKGYKNFPVEQWANAPPNSDERIKSLYKNLIVNSYRDQYGLVEKAINICLEQNKS